MRFYRHMMTMLLMAIGFIPTAWAAGDPGMNAATSAATFAEIFGNHSAFSATAQMHIDPGKGEKSHTTQMKYAMRDGKVRMSMNMAKMSEDMPPDAVARMKQMGMVHYVVILHPGTDNRSLVLYPDLKAYVQNTGRMTNADKGKLKVEKTKIGTGRVAGHPCEEYRITVTRPDGQQSSMTEWQATDMDNFPIKLEMKNDGTVTSLLFTHINHSAPPASLFEVPAGYKKYDSMQQLMMSQIRKMMGNMGNMMHGRTGQ